MIFRFIRPNSPAPLLSLLTYYQSNNVPALRLFSPVATNSRTAAKETVLPRGGGKDGSLPVLVRKGTLVRWLSHCLHRNKAVFGPDADEFRPERWDDLRVGYVFPPYLPPRKIAIAKAQPLFCILLLTLSLFFFLAVKLGVYSIQRRAPDLPCAAVCLDSDRLRGV